MTSQSKPAKFHIKPVRLQARESAIVASEADVALATGHYREATELYKELVKRERRPAWIEALALCYAARANELAAKHMFKEALVLWRNRAQSCGKPLAERVYFDWLARAGEQAEMVRLLQTGGLAAAALAELEMRLAPSSSESRGQGDLGSVPPLQYQRAGVPPLQYGLGFGSRCGTCAAMGALTLASAYSTVGRAVRRYAVEATRWR